MPVVGVSFTDQTSFGVSGETLRLWGAPFQMSQL